MRRDATPRRRHLVRTATLAALLAATATLVGAGPVQAGGPRPRPAPAGDAFYTPPSPLPAGRPGDVIWSRPVTLAPFALVLTMNATAYQVLYRSTDALGHPDAVSGTVLVPKGVDLATVPIVGLADGTQGLGDACAPSKELVAGADYGALQAADLIGRGWAVAYTDYQGLGTPGTHTYMVGRSEGHAVIDAVRAAQRLPLGLSRTAKVAFFGYSQGGGAAAWAGELQPSYAPELRLAGIAAGGVPADLVAASRQLEGGVGFGVLVMAAIGFDAAYPELHLAAYLTAAGAATFAGFAGSCIESMVAGLAFHRIAEYATSDPMLNAGWQARLAQNSLGAAPPRAPIFLYQGIIDEVVDSGQVAALRQTYCSAGVRVYLGLYPGEHVVTGAVAEGAAVGYLADRFAGKPAPTNC